jgi:hypothetical protein
VAQRIATYHLPARGAKKGARSTGGRKVTKTGSDKLRKLWPEEVKALKDIATGKTKMIVQDGGDFLKELDKAVNA